MKRLHLKKKLSVKHLGLILMVSVSLYSVVALASHASVNEVNGNNPPDEARSDYLKRLDAQLNTLEKYVDELKNEGSAYESVTNYMTIDDAELLIKDMRGDVIKLQSGGTPPGLETTAALDNRLLDIRNTLSQVQKADRQWMVVTRN